MGEDVIVACQNFFINGYFQEGLNDIGTGLIPKQKSLVQMGDLRLISLCNVVYKIIEKIIAY